LSDQNRVRPPISPRAVSLCGAHSLFFVLDQWSPSAPVLSLSDLPPSPRPPPSPPAPPPPAALQLHCNCSRRPPVPAPSVQRGALWPPHTASDHHHSIVFRDAAAPPPPRPATAPAIPSEMPSAAAPGSATKRNHIQRQSQSKRSSPTHSDPECGDFKYPDAPSGGERSRAMSPQTAPRRDGLCQPLHRGEHGRTRCQTEESEQRPPQ